MANTSEETPAKWFRANDNEPWCLTAQAEYRSWWSMCGVGWWIDRIQHFCDADPPREECCKRCLAAIKREES